MIKVLPLEGIDSYWALQAYIKLMLGLKMLPAYMGEDYEEFFGRIEKMPVDDRKRMVREACLFVTLNEDEVAAMLKFTTDGNGVPYGRENIRKLAGDKIMELIVAVAQACAAIDVNFLGPAEKKN